MGEVAHRSGVCALLGRPNAGKSTLLNALLGEKLAIVTAKPQTTRSRILGVLTLEAAQVLLVDTPGVHTLGRRLNEAMREVVDHAAADCDVACLLVDPRAEFGEDLLELTGRVRARGAPLLLVATKIDLPEAREAPWPPPGAPPVDACLRISARSGEGLDELLAEIVARLPASPPLFPADELSDRPLRFLAAELVREAAFEELGQELPYALAVEVLEWKEPRPGLTRVRANLIVERASQKRIVVGAGGSMIKRIGTRARPGIERLSGTRVHLELWVKVEPRWARSPKRLKSLGYS